jgi:DNA-binding beta-propeller fold protein YncE
MTELPIRRAFLHLTLIAALATSFACGGGEESSVPECSDESGTACTWAGVKEARGFNDDGLHRQESWLYYVSDLTWGPDGLAWLVDWNNHRVRRVEADDTLTTVIGTDYEGDGPPGEVDRLPEGNPKGAPGTEVALNHPTDLEFMADGTLLMAAWHNNKIRVFDPETEIVTVLAGNSYGFAGDDGEAWAALFNQPKAVVVDEDENIYTIDQRNERIRVIKPGDSPTIHTIAGTGEVGYSGDGGPALEAEFHFDIKPTPLPSGSLVLRDGILYVADSLNHCIRAIDLETGVVESIAGTGEAGYSGDGSDALAAKFNQPLDIEFGPDGLLYVADTFNNAIRAIDLESGIVETVAGNGEQCARPINCFEEEENLPAREVQFSEPYGIAFDDAGDLYVADTNNSRVVKITR